MSLDHYVQHRGGVHNPAGTKLARRFAKSAEGAVGLHTQVAARWRAFRLLRNRGHFVALEHLVSPFSVGLPSLIHPSDPRFKRAQRTGDANAQSR